MDGRADLTLAKVIAGQFHELADFLYGGGDPHIAWQRLVECAVRAIPGCAWAAVTVWADGEPPRSLASSDRVSTVADHLQYEHLHGPCLTAADEHDANVVTIANVVVETRWPAFTRALFAETPIRAALSMQLVGPPMHAALNMYGSQPGAFDDVAINAAALFREHTRLLLMRTGSVDREGRLQRAPATSRQIGEAVEALIRERAVTHDEAFEMLVSRSEQLHRPLYDVGTGVADSRTLPT